MKAISLWQPWASAIAWGYKRFETRGWSTRYRGPLAIHAARRPMDRFGRSAFLDAHVEAKGEFHLGKVLAVVNMRGTFPTVDVVKNGRILATPDYALGDWSRGRVAWYLEGVVALPEPVPMNGRQGLWTPNPDELAAIERQLALVLGGPA